MSKYTITIVVIFSIFLPVSIPVLADDTDSSITSEDTVSFDSSIENQDSSVVAGSTDSESLYPMSPERKEKLIAYSQFKNIWRFVSFFIELGILALILFTGLSARLRNWAQVAGKKFFILWLFVVLLFVLQYLFDLPFNIYRNFVVENNFGFMNQTFTEWFFEDLLNLFITAVIVIIPVWFLYWVIGKTRKWWLSFSLGSIPFIVLLIVIAPVFIDPLFNDFVPMEDKRLESELRTLASNAGIEGADIFQVNASKQSSKINAYVTGLFGSKRIVLYDTMIDNFTYDEIKFVMGHEMGHYIKNHIWQMLPLLVFLIGLALFITDRTIHPFINRFKHRFKFDSLQDIASLPLIIAYISILFFIFNPIGNSFSRHMERVSDKYGMDVSGVSGEVAAVAFEKLSVFNLSDPDPHPVIDFWFYTHPALNKRIDFVRGYNKQ